MPAHLQLEELQHPVLSYTVNDMSIVGGCAYIGQHCIETQMITCH